MLVTGGYTVSNSVRFRGAPLMGGNDIPAEKEEPVFSLEQLRSVAAA